MLLYRLPCHPTRRPSPLEIIAAEPTGYIDDFTNEIKTLCGSGFHCFLVQPVSIDAAEGNFGRAVAFRTSRFHLPFINGFFDGEELLVGKVRQMRFDFAALGNQLRQPLR